MIPFCCPVCQGRGTLPAGFYSRARTLSNTAPETCKTCNGQGIVWAGGPPQRVGVGNVPKIPQVSRTTGTPLPVPDYRVISEKVFDPSTQEWVLDNVTHRHE